MNETSYSVLVATIHNGNLNQLRAMWKVLRPASGITNESARFQFKGESPQNALMSLLDYAQQKLYVATRTGKTERVLSHFGTYRNEPVYNVDTSKFEALCAQALEAGK